MCIYIYRILSGETPRWQRDRFKEWDQIPCIHHQQQCVRSYDTT